MANLVLVAEDDEDDRFLIAEAFKCFTSKKVDFVENGEELINYLQRNKQNTSLILLDLNMPVMDGREALKIIHQDPDLSKIPIVVLTTSREEADQRFCKKNGAKVFLTKPSSFDDLIEMLQSAVFECGALAGARSAAGDLRQDSNGLINRFVN